MKESDDPIQLPQWVIGVLLTLLIALSGFIFTTLEQRVDKLEQRLDRWEEQRGIKNGH